MKGAKWTQEEWNVFREMVFGGFSDEEIAERLGRPVGVVRVFRTDKLKVVKKPRRLFKVSEIRFIKEKAEEGWRVKTIAEALNRRAALIAVVMKRFGIVKKGHYGKWTPEEDEKLKKLFYQGFCDKRIAQKLGRTEDAVLCRRVRKLKLRRDKEETYWRRSLNEG